MLISSVPRLEEFVVTLIPCCPLRQRMICLAILSIAFFVSTQSCLATVSSATNPTSLYRPTGSELALGPAATDPAAITRTDASFTRPLAWTSPDASSGSRWE